MAELEFNYGAMNCGKTTLLLQTVHNYERRGNKVLVFKHERDDKGGEYVETRIGLKRKCDAIIPVGGHVYDYVDFDNPPSAIFVDEAQFLDSFQVDELFIIASVYDIPVFTYGLRTTFQLGDFPGSPRLLALATTLSEIKVACTCRNKATQNVRYYLGKPVFEGDPILIDNQENQENNYSYDSFCNSCYAEMRDMTLPIKKRIRKKGGIINDRD